MLVLAGNSLNLISPVENMQIWALLPQDYQLEGEKPLQTSLPGHVNAISDNMMAAWVFRVRYKRKTPRVVTFD